MEEAMLTAIVMINAERQKIGSIGKVLADIEGVSEAYSVTGEYDFIVIIRVQDHDRLAEIVTEKLSGIDGIQKTKTAIAFKCYSKYDLEKMWSIGFENNNM
jgi:DNA-binding Lrp family transcriptional regulator